MNPRLYFFAERLFVSIHNGLAAVIQGIGLGLMSNRSLEGITQYRYVRHCESFVSLDYLNSGLLLWERDAIRKFFPERCRVLVAAAGAGREIIALNRDGFQADGFDCCELMVVTGNQALKKLQIPSRLDLAAASSVPDYIEKYDAAIVGFSGYMYIPGRERRISFLSELRRHLRVGAPVLISFIERASGRRARWTARIGTAIRKLRNGPAVEEGDVLKDGFQHHFDEHQVFSEMKEAGLEPAYYSGGSSYGHAVGFVTSKE